MNINILARIAMGIYKHQEDLNIQVSYKSKLVWIKEGRGWKEFTFKQLVSKHAPNNEYLLKMIGEA
ncbi:hypothetical protein IBZ20DMU1_26 [Acinetobacter phage DMU1]|nr:hypothetical protein IBZ20DMU1_26 [Acinetobacter phage DMU1]